MIRTAFDENEVGGKKPIGIYLLLSDECAGTRIYVPCGIFST
jgi:hypothetical protein